MASAWEVQHGIRQGGGRGFSGVMGGQLSVMGGGGGMTGIVPLNQVGMGGMPPGVSGTMSNPMPMGAPPGVGMAPGWVRDAVMSLRNAAVAQGGNVLGKKKSEEEEEAEAAKKKANQPPDHYGVLSVKKTADEAAIKKSYRKLVLQWHPDKHPANRTEADKRIREINLAYEILSHAMKRSGYDMMLEAMERKKRGVKLETSFIQPRMSIPKEFLLCPLGHPDKFVRIDGNNVRVQSRDDARGVGFNDFFRSAKFILWWMPEVNNMCRCRSVDSLNANGVFDAAGGMNLSFVMEGAPTEDGMIKAQESEVELSMSEDPRFSYLIAVASPYSPGAFRFEGSFWPGHYLTYRQSHGGLHMAALQDELTDHTDFVLADYGTMYKHMDIHEAFASPVDALGDGTDYVKLSELRADPRIKAYFQATLGNAPIWTNKEFELFFEAHYEKWDFDKKRARVRVRSRKAQLMEYLERAKQREELVSNILSAGRELGELPHELIVTLLAKLTTPGSFAHAREETLVAIFTLPEIGKGKDVTLAQKQDLLSALRRLLIVAPSLFAAVGVSGPPLLTLLAIQRVLVAVRTADPKLDNLQEATVQFMHLIRERLRHVPDEGADGGDAAPVAAAELFITGACLSMWPPADAAELLLVPLLGTEKVEEGSVANDEQIKRGKSAAAQVVLRYPKLTASQLLSGLFAATVAGASASNKTKPICEPLVEVMATECTSRLDALDVQELLQLTDCLVPPPSGVGILPARHYLLQKLLTHWEEVLKKTLDAPVVEEKEEKQDEKKDEKKDEEKKDDEETKDENKKDKKPKPPQADDIARLAELIVPMRVMINGGKLTDDEPKDEPKEEKPKEEKKPKAPMAACEDDQDGEDAAKASDQDGEDAAKEDAVKEDAVKETWPELEADDIGPVCPSGHPLITCKSPEPAQCDKCMVKIKMGTTIFGCRLCNYDECENCCGKPDVQARTKAIQQSLTSLLTKQAKKLSKTGKASLEAAFKDSGAIRGKVESLYKAVGLKLPEPESEAKSEPPTKRARVGSRSRDDPGPADEGRGGDRNDRGDRSDRGARRPDRQPYDARDVRTKTDKEGGGRNDRRHEDDDRRERGRDNDARDVRDRKDRGHEERGGGGRARLEPRLEPRESHRSDRDDLRAELRAAERKKEKEYDDAPRGGRGDRGNDKYDDRRSDRGERSRPAFGDRSDRRSR